MRKPNPQEELKIDKAIRFLAEKMAKSGNNPKPVVFHSIRVGNYIWNLGCSTNCVIAAFLHDLVEDSNTSIEYIEKDFGKEVSNLVEVTTFNSLIKDKTERYMDSFTRANAHSIDALLIRAADILDNSNYYELAIDKESFSKLLIKMKAFIDISNEKIGKTPIWNQLVDKYNKLLSSSVSR